MAPSAGFTLGATSIAVQMGLFLQAGQDTAKQGRANFIVWGVLREHHRRPHRIFRYQPRRARPVGTARSGAVLLYGAVARHPALQTHGDATLRRVIILFVLVITSASLVIEYL